MNEHDAGASTPDAGWPRLEALLDEALELSAAERRSFLDRLDQEEPTLRARLEALLSADDAAGAFLRDDAAAWLPALAPGLGPAEAPALSPATRIGPYRIVHEIGRGGMGIVYLAERADGQFEQRVALKLVRRGLDDEETVRFRRERQILARLEHPNIARLFDGGVHTDGRPYFVMELVEGEPITAFCDRRQLTVDARLRLFCQVCEAVQYAHRNLVVHRDLKPSNVLVNAGAPKLLDFGIAKLLIDASEPAGPEMTRTGTHVMTPAYAAPEQVRGEAVSTATDVYALGVVLFELLTGRRPFGSPDSRAADLERAILETQPARPSTVVTRAAARPGDALPESVARARGTAPAALRRRLSGDLDAIVLKALRKESEHRYPTAAALADDIERSLDGRPVRARPEGRRYRAAKFVRRHRGAIAAAAVLVLSLVGGLAAVAWQARSTALEARKAETVKEFLVSLFQSADPAQTGADISLREVLDRGAERARQELDSQPEVQGELMTVLAGIYSELGVLDRAQALAEQAQHVNERVYGSESSAVATNLRQQAMVAYGKGQAEQAEGLARRALELHERGVGGQHPDVAEDLDVLAIALRQRGRMDEALAAVERSLAIRRAHYGEEHTLTAESMTNLAVVMRELGRYDESAALYQEALDRRRQLLGDGHPHVALTRLNFAALEHFRGRYEFSAELAEQARADFVRLYGEEYARALAASSLRAANERMLGRYDEAEAGMLRVIDIWRRTLGEDHPNALLTHAGLARLYRERGELQRAEALLRRVDARWRERMGEGHPTGALIRRQLGGVLGEIGRHDEAQALLDETLDRLTTAHGESHPEVADTLHELGVLARRRGDLPTAQRRLDEALAMRTRLLGERHPATAQTLAAAGAVRRAAGDAAAARALLDRSLAILRTALPPDHPAIVDARRERDLAR